MKYVFQFFIIMAITLMGEILHAVIPAPIPASIYGLILILLCFVFKIIKIEQVEDTANFLIEFMSIMYIPIAAGLLNTWSSLSHIVIPVIVIIVVSTIVVMGVTGKTAELVIYLDKRRRRK